MMCSFFKLTTLYPYHCVYVSVSSIYQCTATPQASISCSVYTPTSVPRVKVCSRFGPTTYTEHEDNQEALLGACTDVPHDLPFA